MSRSCNCFTTWGTNIFSCSDCWEIITSSIDNVKAEVEKFTTDLLAQLGQRGSITLQTFRRQNPQTPGTSAPGSTLVSRYCTSNDWFRIRNFRYLIKIDGKGLNTLEMQKDTMDCTPFTICPTDEGPSWIGYWWIVDKTCSCVGPVPEGIGGVLVGEHQLVSKTYGGGAENRKNVAKTLDMKADWEQQSGRICGAAVEYGDPPQPDGSWRARNKHVFQSVNLRYEKVVSKWMSEVHNSTHHNC
jgi:hypothetical protein